MSHSIRKLLGYGPKDPMIISEWDADDVIDAYRDLVQMAKGAPEFEDLVDGIVNFLDVAADMDSAGEIQKRFCDALKEKIVSDDFKEQVKSILSVVGESRVYSGERLITESMDDVDAMVDQLLRDIKMSRDFSEVASEVSEFIAKLGAMGEEFGSAVEADLVNAMAEFLGSMKKAIVAKAKKAGASADSE